MRNLALLPLLAVLLSACDTNGPTDLPPDSLSSQLWALAATPGFGGISYDASERNANGEPLLVVHTLGESPEAEAEIDRLISGWEHRLNRRPARGGADAALLNRVEAAAASAERVGLNAATGYVEVGVKTVYQAGGVQQALESAGVPFDDVVLLVEDRAASD